MYADTLMFHVHMSTGTPEKRLWGSVLGHDGDGRRGRAVDHTTHNHAGKVDGRYRRCQKAAAQPSPELARPRACRDACPTQVRPRPLTDRHWVHTAQPHFLIKTWTYVKPKSLEESMKTLTTRPGAGAHACHPSILGG